MGRHHGARERRGKVEPGVKVTLARRACVRGSECTVGSRVGATVGGGGVRAVPEIAHHARLAPLRTRKAPPLRLQREGNLRSKTEQGARQGGRWCPPPPPPTFLPTTHPTVLGVGVGRGVSD